jgi:hypothetical protein
VPLTQINDRESFHDVFARILGFPHSYERSMAAWIDLVGGLDTEPAALLRVGRKGVLTLALEGVEGFRKHHPELWDDLIDSAGCVNFRRIVQGQPAMIALAYH